MIGLIILSCLPLAKVTAETRVVAGVIYPLEERTLAMSVSGLVASVLVREGERVTAGQPLLHLNRQAQQLEVSRRRLLWQDDTEIKALTQRLAIVREQLHILEDLYEQSRSISRDELNALRLDVINTEAQLAGSRVQKERERIEYELARSAFAEMELRAPIAGVVTRVARRDGEWAPTGEPILQLVNLEVGLLKVSIPDVVARRLVVEQPVVVSVDGLGERPGQLEYLADVADPASGLVELHIRIDNRDHAIRPGSKAQVAL
ncbi:MAG: efflux RND transporter periplasmic adaptor subunit [Marinobacter sp.]|nr:efflux RND transporter periplasmic adaptor subunit [Marinobacter sp.]